MSTQKTYKVKLPIPHKKQKEFIDSTAKRKIIRAGRRGGKTVGAAEIAVKKFLAGCRVLYGAPTQDQVERFWTEVCKALQEPISAGIFKKNETLHLIEIEGTEQRIRAKTAWNADTLRGDYADFLILDEFQLMNEDTWAIVGAPMLLDNNGDAVFIYTPPSLHSRSASKADDPRHAPKLFAKAQADKTGRWATFHFTSHDNPYISKIALSEIAQDMTTLAMRQEIMAEDIDVAPGALWSREMIESARIYTKVPEFDNIVVGVDPSATSEGDDAGIIVAARKRNQYFILDDKTIQGSPETWARAAVSAYSIHLANNIVAESNQGGEMVASVIRQVDENIMVNLVHASRGKSTRAEPIAAVYEQGRVHHIGNFSLLEDEMCQWVPGDKSPNRMDALVWALTELMEGELPLTSTDAKNIEIEEMESITISEGY
jgi:phage terminase large subunit-like protein